MKTLIAGDCLDILPTLPPASVDLIAADLPYGKTPCAWDRPIDLGRLWEQYRRVLKPAGVVVLTGVQPFTSELVQSNRAWFRFEDIWDKRRPTSFLNAKKMPLRRHENLLIFSPALMGRFTYNPQMRKGKLHRRGGGSSAGRRAYGHAEATPSYSDLYYPTSIIDVPLDGHQGAKVHGTQKSVALMEYIVRTYSNEGDTVLDNTMGSGTTGEACDRTGRNFIGIEKDPDIFETARARLEVGTLAGVL
jgi:site-specific DNA-methyltransferase (adenine-specific)